MSTRYVDRGQGPVRNVHRADEVRVRGQMKRSFPVPRVGEVQRVLGVALVVFEQCEHLAEDLCGIAAVDLLDDHDVVAFAVLAGVLGGGEQRAVDQGEFAVGAGSEPRTKSS